MILDTVALSCLLDGDPKLRRVLQQAERSHLPVIVLGEYRFGLARSRHRERLQDYLARIQEHTIFLTLDTETTSHYADIRLELRVAGRPIPSNDLWIAALARQHGLPVVSRDKHYGWIKGVKRIGW